MAESLFALSDEIVVDQLKLNAKKRETQQHELNQHMCGWISGENGYMYMKKIQPQTGDVWAQRSR